MNGSGCAKAIRFEKPDRVPMLHFNFDKEDSDIVLVDIQRHFGGADGLQSEWGFVWERVDGTMGQVREPLLKTERDAAALRAPALRAGERMAAAKREMAQYGPDKYFLASMQLTEAHNHEHSARLCPDAGGSRLRAGACAGRLPTRCSALKRS